ncbi:hypothetical protein [Cupriavidus basilensis]|uniref:hypothetical protein n=1 Tax=Cupriavidus basilensis TaxID=68895 RepID=UPI0039F742FE
MGHYTATAKKNPGRKGWLVEFRHPLRMDAANKPGKKTRKGLGTEDEATAQQLASQLNELLADESLWSFGMQSEAAKRYDARIVEIFFSEMEPRSASHIQLRDTLLPLPSRKDGYARIVLMGVPGAGKTTLVRQLMGTNPETERFPSTSVNRTTTFPTEVSLREGPFEAVVTFMSEYEARFEIEESLSAALVEAVEGGANQIARALLEKSDMRFRLKYLLGDIAEEEVQDPYEEDEENEAPSGSTDGQLISPSERAAFERTLTGYIERISCIATKFKELVETDQGILREMSAEDKSAALDLIEEQASASDEFIELVSEVLDEVRTKFKYVTVGRYDKTNTGWPRAWYFKCEEGAREAFLSAVRYFSGISYLAWGKLLTPLVDGLRVAGPFKPTWAEQAPRLVLIDTEGLGHKANATADLPEQVLALLHESDVVLLVDSAKNGMTNFAAGKALEGVVNTGHTKKLAVVFTHMDTVKGDNLKGQAKFDHVFGGLRNVADNQLAKNVSADAARYLISHLERSTFYVGKIDELDPKPARPELNKLLAYLAAAQPPVFEPVAFPDYSIDNLAFAIQEAAKGFRGQWHGYLGLSPDMVNRAKAWQTVKALSRRYAEGWDDGFVLRPVANLNAALLAAVSRFLESPIGWTGRPTADQKREIMDSIKTEVAKKFPDLSKRRLRDLSRPEWSVAYHLSGKGSTVDRKIRIESIYERWVPIPGARGGRDALDFLTEVKAIVTTAVEELKREVQGESA